MRLGVETRRIGDLGRPSGLHRTCHWGLHGSAARPKYVVQPETGEAASGGQGGELWHHQNGEFVRPLHIPWAAPTWTSRAVAADCIVSSAQPNGTEAIATRVDGLVNITVDTAVESVQSTVCSRLPKWRTEKPVRSPQQVVAMPTAAP